MDCDGATGYVLEVDMAYSDHLHDAHNDYAVAPEHITVTKDILYDYNHVTLFVGQTCLIPNLNNKMKYVTHIKNLKLYNALSSLKFTGYLNSSKLRR